MHEPPESPAFASKQATAEYLRDTILKALDKDVEKSRLSIGVHDSPKTNSKYINLYYPDRADNPDPDRVPFTVRISDHFDQQYLFRRNRPNVCLHVVPLLTTREKSLRGISIKVYEGLSMSLQGSLAADVRLELRRLRAKLAEQLDREQKNFQYTYSGDLEGTIDRMRNLLRNVQGPQRPFRSIVDSRMPIKFY